MAGFKSKKARTGYVTPESKMSQDVDREWKDVYPDELAVGDILAGKGLITMKDITCQDDIFIMAGVPDSNTYDLPKNVKVKAFIRKAN
jgi:hypothetical protein